jgi:hypothetical protein
LRHFGTEKAMRDKIDQILRFPCYATSGPLTYGSGATQCLGGYLIRQGEIREFAEFVMNRHLCRECSLAHGVFFFFFLFFLFAALVCGVMCM